MKKWTTCSEGHDYGPPTRVGAGIVRLVCGLCDGVRLDDKNEPNAANDLFASKEEGSKVFGVVQMQQTAAFLATA